MWKTTVIALLVLFRITTGHAGIITLEDVNRQMASVRVVLSTYIGADDSKIGEVITNVNVLSSYRSKEYAYLIEHATNPAYQCELSEGWTDKKDTQNTYLYPNRYQYPNDIGLRVRKLQAGYAGEATCSAEVITMPPYYENWGYTDYYVYNTITAPSEYGPSFATLLPSGVKVTLPKEWKAWGSGGLDHSWNDKGDTFRKAVVKWSATYDDQIQHNVSESNPYVPILTVTDDSNVWAYITITPKDVDAGFTKALDFRMKDGRPCDKGMGAKDQCLIRINA
ncbi:hypothetical protein CV016_20000 [Yersinia kristensenii]|uniref:hypothetical protein n=1 Tax=Yersinia kristensenii TaxID=28152 RepID=UPI000C22A6B1|nr:hypothetical protein [Yersinia kristensenii]PJG60983.1 hypothetical protein CV016_20000 [Yersinia kristensenii]